MVRVPSGLWGNLVPVQVYGANTGVGKTVVSVLLTRHFLRSKRAKNWDVRYLKPVSTGPDWEADNLYLKKYAGNCSSTCLFQFPEPVSPHLAAKLASKPVSDQDLIHQVSFTLRNHAKDQKYEERKAIAFVETAGGVLSPGPSGTPQADLYRSLRLPVLLIGDSRLGGIGATISAYESLTIRGYDIDAIAMLQENTFRNHTYLKHFFMEKKVSFFDLSPLPDMAGLSATEESARMEEYYASQAESSEVTALASNFMIKHTNRLAAMQKLSDSAQQHIWHPFTQHQNVTDSRDIVAIDSAYGDFFQVKNTNKTKEIETGLPVLKPAFDGSASWWTQGLGHGNPTLALAAAYAAGRYGHVMFAGAIHQPAITLAERLLGGMGNPRLRKVFFTDNGSTGTEVALKMALRAACSRYNWDGSTQDVGILGLKGSYHGDTIGAMDASEPSVFNKKVDWYRGRGHWFDFPQIKLRNKQWIIETPTGMENDLGESRSFDDINDIFDFGKRQSDAEQYEKYIKGILGSLLAEGKKFGALIMEPVLLGAGGMIFADPLFQRTLVNAVRSTTFSSVLTGNSKDSDRWLGVPVIFDEVFTGLYRLGRFSAASFLGVHPDISVHAKLLTGGLLPLCTTLASQSVFDAFLGDEKSDALLHGHSYTAHPIGCHVAAESLSEMLKLSQGIPWASYRAEWSPSKKRLESDVPSDSETIWSMWDPSVVKTLSDMENVDYVVAIGSVLAIALKDTSGAGYSSNAAADLQKSLLNQEFSIHSRVLGNIIYFMTSMNSPRRQLLDIQDLLLQNLKGD